MACNSCPKPDDPEFPACLERHPGICTKKNPGNVQSLHLLAHRVMPKFFDGIELDYYHRLAPNKYITAAWVLSHVRAAGFRFGGIYTFRVQDDVMLTPTIIGDIHPTSLASNLNILYYPFKNLRMEAVMQKANEETPVETQYTVELTRPCDTWSANFYNVRQDNGRATFSVMRAITLHWAIGAELLLEWNEPKNLMTDIAIAARYSHHHYSFGATVSRQGLDVSYWQRIHPQIQMANLLAWNRSTRKTIATICYQWNFWSCAVHGMLDSDASVGFMWTKYLSNLPIQMGFSVVMSLPTDRFAFGMRFVLDPSGLRRGD
ncbi:mitochondrial import receptor subunit TOM40 homolog 2 [Scaptodrosophila lebanonensis]|uniref:Mitochondrial import receptor subunit TOM40 homolog 2 n=1 Tax=Drosophila lebanonensis TaxID=7225 RepID=A0A6J2TFB4_DROLE|nr:mitochondrial import receptor subunit TOM40 homolog 2 [Scaptodrosophila lebanonensis]